MRRRPTFVAVGAIERPFYAQLLKGLGLDEDDDAQPSGTRRQLAGAEAAVRDVFRTRDARRVGRDLRLTDACVAPVLTLTEAPSHPHNAERATFVDHGGVTQPAPAPRFSRTPLKLGRPAPAPGDHTDEVLRELGYTADDIDRLRADGAVA